MKKCLRIAFLLLLVGWCVADSKAAPNYGLAADNKIQAQALIQKLMAQNPDLFSAGMHCIPPGGQAQAIVASTLNVIGKPSDPPDIDVGQHGETIISPHQKGPKLGIMLPLHDKSGKLIGALALAFKYPPGDDEVACFAKAVKIRDGLAKEILSLEALFAPAL